MTQADNVLGTGSDRSGIASKVVSDHVKHRGGVVPSCSAAHQRNDNALALAAVMIRNADREIDAFFLLAVQEHARAIDSDEDGDF